MKLTSFIGDRDGFLFFFAEAVMQNPLVTATESEIEHLIMTWLRNAADRNGGRRVRMQTKCAAEAAEAALLPPEAVQHTTD